MNYGIFQGSIPHVDVLRQLHSQRPSGGAMANQGWHTQPGRTGSSMSVGVQLIGLCPIVMGEAGVLETLSFEVVTASAGATGKIGLYDSDPFGMPAFLRGRFQIAGADTADLSTTGFKDAHVGMLLEPGLFFGALWTSGTGAAFRSYEGTGIDSLNQAAAGEANNVLPASFYLTSVAFTEFPGYMGSTRLTGSSPGPRASWKITS